MEWFFTGRDWDMPMQPNGRMTKTGFNMKAGSPYQHRLQGGSLPPHLILCRSGWIIFLNWDMRRLFLLDHILLWNIIMSCILIFKADILTGSPISAWVVC